MLIINCVWFAFDIFLKKCIFLNHICFIVAVQCSDIESVFTNTDTFIIVLCNYKE